MQVNTKSLRWGVSYQYRRKIKDMRYRNACLRFRKTKLPVNSWRTVDEGHFHFKWSPDDGKTFKWGNPQK